MCLSLRRSIKGPTLSLISGSPGELLPLAISKMKFAMSALLVFLVLGIVECSTQDQAEFDEWVQGLEDILDSSLPGSEDRIQGQCVHMTSANLFRPPFCLVNIILT